LYQLSITERVFAVLAVEVGFIIREDESSSSFRVRNKGFWLLDRLQN